jgi:mycofactocin precursor
MDQTGTELLDRPAEDAGQEAADVQPDDVVAADLLVEEISIDGMCGVY